MSKKKTLYFESLDEGFVLTSGGKTKAIQNSKNLKDELLEKFGYLISRVGHADVRNMSITIEVDENLPQPTL